MNHLPYDWYAHIRRDPNAEYGAGVLELYHGTGPGQDSIVAFQCPVITGPKSHPPAKEYGGIMPPIRWIMIDRIKYRKHPLGHFMEMAILIPFPGDCIGYRKRTYATDKVPFMTHKMGRSTGCEGPRAGFWQEYMKRMNEAFDENGGLIISTQDVEGT